MINPMNSYILIEYKKEEKTSGGLYMPANTSATNFLVCGKVLAINESNKLKLTTDSTIYFNKNAMVKVPEEENQVLVREEDIYAIKA